MPERTYSAANAYRYGFNGQERTDEIKGDGNSYNAEFWEYDPRLGRRWNIDPIVKPYEGPYTAFGNNPLLNIDPNGADSAKYLTNSEVADAVKIAFNIINEDIKNKSYNYSDYYGNKNEAKVFTAYQAYVKSHGNMSFGALTEFYDYINHYVKGFNEVALGSKDAWNKLDNLIEKAITPSTITVISNAYITKYNGFALNVVRLGMVALGTALSAIGTGPTNEPRMPVSVQQIPSRGNNIALGVSETLPDFAELVGGQTWHSWGRANFRTNFIDVINKPTNRIHFNLTGPDGKQINVWNAVKEGAQGFKSSRATSWELYQLYINPSAQSRTTFYYNNQPIKNPFK